MKKYLISFLTLAIVLGGILQPSSAQAAENTIIDENSSIEAVELALEKYTTVTEEGRLNFDIELAIASGESDFIIETGKMINEIDRQYNPDPDTFSIAASLPIWGNWCGPGYGGGRALDYLDAACRTHDLNYAYYGYFHCASDKKLVTTISADYSKMKAAEKVAANAVRTYFIAQINTKSCK